MRWALTYRVRSWVGSIIGWDSQKVRGWSCKMVALHKSTQKLSVLFWICRIIMARG